MKRAEILLYGNIGSDWWMDGVGAKEFRSLFSAAEKDNSIEGIDIRINSPGGFVSDGIAIYNTIANSKKEVHTYIDGIAFSMGAIIALAGDKVFMANNATMLLHNAWGVAIGNSDDMLQTVELLDKMDEGLINSVADKTGMKAEDVKKKWFDYKDHTFSAQDAFNANLVDEVIDRKADVPDGLKDMSESELFAHYAKLPKSEKKNFFSRIEDKIEASIKKITKTKDDMKIKFKNSWAALSALLAVSFAAGETEKEVELKDEHLEKINAELTSAKALKDSVAAKDTEIENLKAEIVVLKKPAGGAAAPVSSVTGEQEEEENAEVLSETDKEARAAYNKNKKKTTN